MSMKFDNAFKTAEGFVGMQFVSKDRRTCTVYRDKDGVHITEGFGVKDADFCLNYYLNNNARFSK